MLRSKFCQGLKCVDKQSEFGCKLLQGANNLGSKVCISHNKATIIVFCLANNIFMVARRLRASHKTDYDCWLEFFVAH